jgi:hypothetical protein
VRKPRGQKAWSRIKTTVAEQRELWKQVGEALLVGRRLHKADQKFSQWCKENGFDMSRKARADAMWWSGVYSNYTPPEGISHPSNIREGFNEQAPSPSPEVALNESDKPRQRIPLETAKKINKLSSMAESGEGQEH